MLKSAIDKLGTRGYSFYSECDTFVIFKNISLSTTLKFNKKKPSYTIYDTYTGHAVAVRWSLQKAIDELFIVYDYRALGLIKFLCKELDMTKEQLALRIPISVAVLNRGEKNIYSISESSLEKIIDYAEEKGLI